jgi:hypothetical protein
MKLTAALAGILLIALPFSVFADSATSTSFHIESGVIDAGGTRTTSSNYGLRSSIGQPATGISTSTSFILRGGFLNFPLPVVVPPVTPTAPLPGILVGGGAFAGLPPEIQEKIIKRCDFNGDMRCNLVDLSILLYYYDRIGSAIARYDLNSNDRVDFPDISVMMYYWTG